MSKLEWEDDEQKSTITQVSWRLWRIKACGNEKLNVKNARICSAHFTEDCFERKPEHLIVPGDKNVIRLRKTAIPTLNLDNNDDNTRRGRKRKVLQECEAKENDEPSTSNAATCTFPNLENDMDDQIEELKKSNVHLEQKCSRLDDENKRMKEEIMKLNKKLRLEKQAQKKALKTKIYEILSPVFTTGQIKMLLHPTQKRVQWSIDDIASATALRSVSSKTYRYLRKKNFPLPALSTLKKRASSECYESGNHKTVIIYDENKNRDVSLHHGAERLAHMQ